MNKKPRKRKNKYTDEYLKNVLLNKAEELGRTPKKREVPHYSIMLERLGNGSWLKVIELVNLPQNDNVYSNTYTKEELIKIMKDWHKKNGRVPRMKDFNSEQGLPSFGTYLGKFNKRWSEIVYDILELETLNGPERRFKSKGELILAFRNEFYKIMPKNRKEFDMNKTSDFPYLDAIKSTYGLEYVDLMTLAGIEHTSKTQKEKWKELLVNAIADHGYPPSVKVLESKYGILHNSLRHHLGNYNDALKDLGFTPSHTMREDVTEDSDELLQDYIEYSRQLGKLATIADIKQNPNMRGYKAYSNRFGSMYELKRKANEVLNFSDLISDNRKYTKKWIAKELLRLKNIKGSRLTLAEIQKNKNLPDPTTINKYFRTTKMSEVWGEIQKEGKQEL